MKKSSLLFILCSCVALLCSCDDSKNISIGSSSENITSNALVTYEPTPVAEYSLVKKYGEKLAPFANIQWQEEFSATVNNINYTFTANASTKLTDKNIDTVFQCEYYNNTADTREYFAKTYLDKGTIYYYDPEFFPKTKLAEATSKAREELANAKAALDDAKRNGFDTGFYQAEYDLANQKLTSYQSFQDIAKDYWTEATDFNCKAFCNIDVAGNELAYLTFQPFDSTNDSDPCYNLELMIKGDYSTLSEDEIVDTANSILEKAALGPYQVDKSSVYKMDTGGYIVDAFLDIPTPEVTRHMVYFNFTDNQVIMDIHIPIKIVSSTEDVPLISFQEVKKIIKANLPAAWHSYLQNYGEHMVYDDSTKIHISKLCLSLDFDFDSECFIPTWIIGCKLNEVEYNVLYIEAIDGSIRTMN